VYQLLNRICSEDGIVLVVSVCEVVSLCVCVFVYQFNTISPEPLEITKLNSLVSGHHEIIIL